MTPEHMLPIASISQTFVATRVLQLVAEGDLSLDDTLSDWWPDIPNAESITIRQLLNHTSGLPNYRTNTCWLAMESDLEHEWTIEEFLACIDGANPLSAPGEEWHHSHTNYVLLGSIVETITGNALHDEVRTNLLSPLGLDHTFSLQYEDPPGDLARSYEWSNNGWIDVTDNFGNYSFGYAGGDIASDPGDLPAWARALLAGQPCRRRPWTK